MQLNYEACEKIIDGLLAGENPTEVFLYMLENYPEFEQFVSQHSGKTTEDIAKEYKLKITY